MNNIKISSMTKIENVRIVEHNSKLTYILPKTMDESRFKNFKKRHRKELLKLNIQ